MLKMLKKYTSLILAFLFILTSFASCAESGGDKSDAESQPDESGNASEESSAAEIPAGAQAIDAALKYDLPAEYAYVNIIDGNAYTINLESYKHYPDDGKKLTDNDDAVLNETDKWVGFLGRNDIEITVNLGGLKTNLGGFSINARYDVNAGDNIPKTCELWISNDGEEYTRIAAAVKYPEVLGASCIYTLSAYTQKGFDAAYVKLVLTDFISQWTLIDAVRVYRISVADKTSDYYINEPMPENVVPSYWEASETDYTEHQNLLSGLGQRVYTEINLDDAVRTEYYNTPAASAVLTDGKRGGSNYADTAYFHITKGVKRYFVYDLGRLSEISKAVVGAYVFSEYGISYPDSIAVLLSEDGLVWQTVIYKTAAEFPNAVNTRADISLDFAAAYKARFVKFALTVSSHIWLDEFEVWGTKEVTASAKTPKPDQNADFDKGYPSPDSLAGCENILLAYNYKTENVAVGRTTKAGYLPYVGYYGNDGVLSDYFFDAYLYLPCMTVCPSGGRLYSGSDTPSVMTDWLDYENDVFYENANVRALEEAVGEVKNALGDGGYQVKVFLSVFNPDVKCKAFGDINGDGKSEDMSVLADRKAVVKWWIDRQIDKYDSFAFANQKLVGFYWYDEALDLANQLNKETLLYALDYIHSLGYLAIWIPYFQASGYTQWEKLGFDAANMQPNYMFNAERTEQVLYDNATLAKLYGMGVEIEISGTALTTAEYHDRYMAYLRVGAECGYMNSIKMYYQDAGPGVFYAAYKSENPYIREIYDMTYKYAKSKLEVSGLKVSETAFDAVTGTQYKGQITLEGETPFSAAVSKCAKYGRVAVSGDGKIIYTPMENFIGTDTFTVEISAGIITKEVIFTVNVHKN